jgi:hypothetical protein
MRREVHCADALAWLGAQPPLAGCSFITSLPDLSEVPHLKMEGWARWFEDAAGLVFSRLADEGVAIFYQSDVKKDGAWVDKGFLVSRAAAAAGMRTLWHKIVCRKPPGTTTHGRAAYSHLLCFSRGVKLDLARALPDVLADGGPTLWTRGMGVDACRLACRFVLESTRTRTVVDPFCGLGSVLAVANDLGLDAVGVELSAKRARRARNLTVEAMTRRC